MGLTPIKGMSSKNKTKKWLKGVQKEASQEINQAQNRLMARFSQKLEQIRLDHESENQGDFSFLVGHR